MRKSFNSRIRKAASQALGTAIFCVTIPVFAQVVPPPFIFSSSLRRAMPSEISFGVSPLTGVVGLTQYVFLNGCAQLEPIYYPAAYVGGTFTVQANGMQSPCVFPIRVLEIRPAALGTGRIILNSPSGVLAEKNTQTVVRSKATVDIDGMWYDDTTNGAGVSFFQSPESGQVLGTWFLYASAPIASAQSSDTPRWYSLQNAAWTAGNVLEGTIFDAKSGARPSPTMCAAGSDCPRGYTSLTPVGSFRFEVSGANGGRIETFDTTGVAVFASNLQRLQF